MEILFLILIGLSAGIVKGTSGFGSSLLAIPLLYLAGFNKLDAVTMMMTCNVMLNILLIYENKSYFHLDTVKKIYPITLAGSLFTALGLYFNGSVSQYAVELFAAALILLAIINKVSRLELKIKDNFISLFSVGILSGIGNGLASIDGPPVVFYLTSIDAPKKRFKSTLAIHFLSMGIIGVGVLIFKGVYTSDLLTSTITLFLSLIIGLLMGMLIGRRLNEQIFRKVILVLLVGLMISLLIP